MILYTSTLEIKAEFHSHLSASGGLGLYCTDTESYCIREYKEKCGRLSALFYVQGDRVFMCQSVPDILRVT